MEKSDNSKFVGFEGDEKKNYAEELFKAHYLETVCKLYHKIKNHELNIGSFNHAIRHSNNLNPFKTHANDVRESINKVKEYGLEKYILFSEPIKNLEEAYNGYL